MRLLLLGQWQKWRQQKFQARIKVRVLLYFIIIKDHENPKILKSEQSKLIILNTFLTSKNSLLAMTQMIYNLRSLSIQFPKG